MTKTISFPFKGDFSVEINNLDARLTNLESNETIYQVFSFTGTTQTGTVSIPTEATIFDLYGDSVSDAIVVKADINQKPLEEVVKTSSGDTVFISSFNNSGVYTLTGIPSEGACIIYFIKIQDIYKDNIVESSIVEVVGKPEYPYLEETIATLEGNGVVSGMKLIINTDTTKFNISSGIYHVIEGGDIIYAGVAGVTVPTITTSNSTYIGLNIDGNIVQQLDVFTPTQRRSIIPLGLLIHSNRVVINAINNLPEVARNLSSQLYDLLGGLRSFNYYGNKFSPNGNNLFFNKSVGSIFKGGVNFENDPLNPHTKPLDALVAPSNIRYRTSTGIESVNTQSALLVYEVGGILQGIPPGRFTIQRIYLFPTNLIRIQPGTVTYGTKALAQQGISSEIYTPEANISQNGLLRGYLIIKHDTTSLENTDDAIFIESDKWGELPLGATGGTTNLQQAYDNSITPEIVTDLTRGALTIKNGSTEDVTCIEVLNNLNEKTLGITNRSIIFNPASGVGLRFDTTTPVYGWNDLIGQIVPRAAGGAAPTLAPLRGTNLLSYSFAVGDIIDNIVYHIPHDYVLGSQLFIHAHWSHNGTAIAGNFGIEYYAQYCKGYGQAGQTFNSELTIPQIIPITSVTTHPRWNHFINEFQLTNLGGDATHLDSSLIEVDGLLIVSFKVTSIPTISGGASSLPFILTVDLHYQSTGLPTKGRNIPFYI